MESPAWEIRNSMTKPGLRVASKGGKTITYLYQNRRAAQKAANWLTSNHVAATTKLKLVVKQVTANTPINVITVESGNKKTLKDQKWIITSTTGNFQGVVNGDDLQKGIPHATETSDAWA